MPIQRPWLAKKISSLPPGANVKLGVISKGSDKTLNVTLGQGNDTLTNIERTQFVDGYLATSPTDTAAEVYRLYQAAFARQPDVPGLGYHIHSLDHGLTASDVGDRGLAAIAHVAF